MKRKYALSLVHRERISVRWPDTSLPIVSPVAKTAGADFQNAEFGSALSGASFEAFVEVITPSPAASARVATHRMPVSLDFIYSQRSATTGSTVVARRAG